MRPGRFKRDEPARFNLHRAHLPLPPPECKVYTPQDLAEAMVHAIDPKPGDLWLDPCMGPGAFVSALRKNGVLKDSIVGVDLDRLASDEDASATTLRGVDFFDWCASTDDRFSKIVANPPYVAICKIGSELQATIKRFNNSEDPSYGLRSNYWCAFLAASLQLLKPNGSLAFVLPAAWDYALYARTLRDEVLSSFSSIEVHRSLEPLFPDVREGRIVLVAKGYRRRPKEATRIDHPTAASLVSALGKSRKPSASTRLPVSSRPQSLLTPFSELFTVRIGCVTGDVNYFLLTESERIRHDLPPGSLRPVLSRARHLTTAQMTKAQWDRLRCGDERIWLFDPTSGSLRSKAVRAYLRHGESVCDLTGYKLRNRDPWYRVPGITPGIGFLSGMANLGPWICLRSMRGLAATNTLYVISSNKAMSMDERAAWALSLLCSETRHQVQSLVRRYPDGLAKLEPRDISALRLLRPKRFDGSRDKYRRAIKLLLCGDVKGATALADASVLHARSNR